MPAGFDKLSSHASVAPERDGRQRAMTSGRRTASRKLVVESLEGRALMSVERSGTAAPPRRPSDPGAASCAEDHCRFDRPKRAILSAIFGGAGHEFVTLAQREIHNIGGVAGGFESGRLKQFTVPGLVFKIANWQSGYTGFPHDPQALTVAGAVLLKRRQIELAAIVRGPFTTYPGTTYVVFAVDRGAGRRLGPVFPERPGITPDALVTVRVGPDGLI